MPPMRMAPGGCSTSHPAVSALGRLEMRRRGLDGVPIRLMSRQHHYLRQAGGAPDSGGSMRPAYERPRHTGPSRF